MSEVCKIMVIAGSLRKDSLNRKLAEVMKASAQQTGAEVTLADLRDYALPIYDGDIEGAGMPENVRRLQSLMSQHDALLIATPEYNGAVPALLKNTLDWMSRPLADGTPGVSLMKDKVVGLSSASPGSLGGLRALLALRDALAKLGFWVAPQQVAVGQAAEAFAADQAELVNEKQQAQLQQLVETVVKAGEALRVLRD